MSIDLQQDLQQALQRDFPPDTTSSDWPPVLVPADRPRRPGAWARRTAVEHADLGVRTPSGGAVLGDVLVAGFAALLYRYTGQNRVSLDRAGADRVRGAERLRFRVSGESTLRDLADSGETVPAPEAAPDVEAVPDLAGAPGPVAVRFALAAEPSAHESAGESPYELQLVVRPGADGAAALELHYDTALFNQATAARLLGHYRTLVQDATASPDRPVARLRLLTDAELRRTLVEWNATRTDLPYDVCLHEAFEARAAEAPDAVAVVNGAERWTYARVNAAANRLAHHLRALGVGPDMRVGLCLDRSPGLLVAVLGILKAGGAYVPIDPDYPALRIATMVSGTSCALMISREALTANLPGAGEGAPLVLLDRDAELLAALPEHDPEPAVGPENLCYIIHTSGSTGEPKPIALRHRGVMNNIADLNTRFEVGPGDSVLALSSPSFDMSVYEFLGLTTAGGTIVIPDPARTKDPAHWAELLASENVTVWNSAPALLGLLADQMEQTGAPPLPSLRLALLGGDWVPVPLFDRVRAFAPALRFIVMGGATEASIHSTIYEVEAADPDWTSIPYGRPMANQRTYILDDALQPVPPGVPGELYLAGIGLARGYLDQPERTAERFTEWSYGEVTGERLYRTGDLARFGADGLIELLGRVDFQVKINGLRVELGEIEAVLRSHPWVRQTAVAAREGRLVAYIVPEDEAPSADELRELGAERLPDYMVPTAFVTMERLPLTPNGKLDRKGLPEPEVTGAAYREPRTPEEKTLAGVYAEVLGLDRVGLDDDFVAMGGDSIRSIQVVTRARALGVEVSARQVLQARTVAELALAATGAEPTAVEDTSQPLIAVSEDDMEYWSQDHPHISDVWPLTPLQTGMLFESTLNDTGHDAYLLQSIYHLSGPVDATRLRAAGQALLERHPNLRAAFVADEMGDTVQIIVDGVELPWREIDLGHLGEGERDEAFRRFLAEDQTVRFDPETPPLLRMTLVTFDPGRAELVLTIHHVLIDGWSEQVVGRDLLRLYAAAGDASALPPARGYRDFLAWLSRQDREASARVWAGELAGVDGPTILVPAEASPGGSEGIGEVFLALSPEESKLLAGCCAELGVTANTVVQGAWAVLLSALTGREDIVFGAVVSGRPGALAGVESMVGLFINTIPVRVRLAPDGTVAGLLTALRDRQTALLDHHHHSLSEIYQAARVETLFDTLVAFQSYLWNRDTEATAAAGIELTGPESVGGNSYPVTLVVEADRVILQYQRHLLDQPTAEDIAAGFHAVLGRMISDPGGHVGAVAEQAGGKAQTS
ncbi:amino acid adenylation domain-containing protein [Sphaerisporangium sp. NPDC051011]|uniref:non-ribosomal peptide synthetase n=1 Tax=Sphaerisporangium sp. NPDC051011 TaxID=3155792 RepID=UPI0033FBD0C3